MIYILFFWRKKGKHVKHHLIWIKKNSFIHWWLGFVVSINKWIAIVFFIHAKKCQEIFSIFFSFLSYTIDEWNLMVLLCYVYQTNMNKRLEKLSNFFFRNLISSSSICASDKRMKERNSCTSRLFKFIQLMMM